MLNRRDFLKYAGVLGLSPYLAKVSWASDKNVVVIGGGAAGVIAANYLKRLVPALSITLIDKNSEYKPAFANNLKLNALLPTTTHNFTYKKLQTNGISFIKDEVSAIDPEKNVISLASGKKINFDRAILAPGVSVKQSEIPGAENIVTSWNASENIDNFHSRLKTMEQGGTVLLSSPAGEISGAWAVYERASQIAQWCAEHNKTAKIILLSGNKAPDEIDLFQHAWNVLYPGKIDTVFNESISEIKGQQAISKSGALKFSVANLIPSNNCNNLIVNSGLAEVRHWCKVTPGSFTHEKYKNIHVLGDNVDSSLGLSKTAQSANAQAKNCAIAIANEIAGRNLFNDMIPMIDSHYAIIGKDYAVSSTRIFKVDSTGKMNLLEKGQSAVNASEKQHQREAQYALSWYKNITGEMFS
ncbi:MAG: FAD-dependent oxidoreductase [Gammaproteobacteria bacterium]|nr:FAD-dependent oxidoreductase [Gammaproteobacteria bacterium]